MVVVEIQLPESLHAKAREVAERENTTLDQFIALALAEKLSALLTEEYLQSRAARGDANRFRRVLQKVPAADPVPGDEIH